MLKQITVRRVIIAIAATAMVGITFASTEADARRGGGGGFRGGVAFLAVVAFAEVDCGLSAFAVEAFVLRQSVDAWT